MCKTNIGKLHSKYVKQRAIIVAIAMVISLCYFCFSFADITAQKNKEKIVVGYPLLNSIHEVDSRGQFNGYNYEYLQELSKYTGWDYEFVIDTWENCMNGLENGTIDLMGYVSKDEDRQAFLTFSKISAGIGNVILISNEKNENLSYMDLKSINNKKVGIIKGSKLEVNLNEFCTEQKINLKKVYFATGRDMMEALAAGNIDVALSTNFEIEEGAQIIAEVNADPFYFALSKNSAKYQRLIAPLDNAMNHIFILNPEYNQSLFIKYISKDTARALNFTEKEKGFIKHSEPIKVAYDPSWAPLIYYDTKDNKAQGAIPNLFRWIENETGLKFNFVMADNYSEALKLVSSGEADIIANIAKDSYWSEEFNIRLTSPYISMPIELVTNEIAQSNVIVMPKGYIPQPKAEKLENDNEVKYVDSVEECYMALSQGQAKSTYSNHFISNYMINEKGYSNLKSSSLVDENNELCLGLYDKSPEELISIMDKTISRLSRQQASDFAMNAAMELEDKSLKKLIYKNPGLTSAVVMAILALSFIISHIYRHERKRSEKVIQYNLVTGIWNFSKFTVEAEKILKATSNVNHYAILHIDICKFRFLNDNYGFETGNKVLKAVAEVFSEFAEPDELYASLWADHFVCLVKCKEETVLLSRARMLMERVNQEIYDFCDYRLTVKAGAYFITESDLKEGKSINDMLQYANHALTTISDSYKNSMAIFNSSMKKEIETFRLVNQDMINAFYDKQFIPYYQPKYNIHTQEIIGAEALVRWIHPEKGLMQPSDFLPYFERSGFIVEVDLYIFEETCKNIRRWINNSKKPIVISCNFSRLHIENPEFAKKVKEIVSRYKIPCDLLELELTETIAVEEMEDITKQIKALHDAGFNVSIDDFGSGYSSLSVLQQLRVDTIKLDRTFLKNGIPTDREYKVMEAIVNLAEQLHMKVICEGVETLEQVELLKQTNCEAAQGYYFAKPMPIEELDELLLDK